MRTSAFGAPLVIAANLAAPAAGLTAESAFGGAPIAQPAMRTLLFNVFGQLVPSPGEFAARCQIADTTYLGVSAEFVRQAILTDPVLAPVNYVNDLFDCDDYVQYLRTRMALLGANRRLAAPLAVGFILTAEHAFNFCVGPTGQLTLINTQSDDRAVVSDPSAFAAFMWVSNANRVQSIYV